MDVRHLIYVLLVSDKKNPTYPRTNNQFGHTYLPECMPILRMHPDNEDCLSTILGHSLHAPSPLPPLTSTPLLQTCPRTTVTDGPEAHGGEGSGGCGTRPEPMQPPVDAHPVHVRSVWLQAPHDGFVIVARASAP